MHNNDLIIEECVKCGYCCSKGPCAYGVWNEEKKKCEYLTEDKLCSKYDEIIKDPNQVSNPAFGYGCSSTLFNTARNDKLIELAKGSKLIDDSTREKDDKQQFDDFVHGRPTKASLNRALGFSREMFIARFQKESQELSDWFDVINKREIPETTPRFVQEENIFASFSMPNENRWREHAVRMECMGARWEVISVMGFTLLEKGWIKQLADYIGDKKCLEVMAGVGSLTYALKECGVDIRATDNFTWHGGEQQPFWKNNLWTEVEDIDSVEAIEKYGKDVGFILMSWPTRDDTAYRCLMKMREVNTQCRLIFMGDFPCIANDNFYDAAQSVIDEEFRNINMPSWMMCHDRLALYK